MAEVEIGIIENYFDKIEVAAIALTDGELMKGDRIHIKGHTTDFTVTVESMQIEHQAVEKAKKGDSIGIKLGERARRHDKVYKVTD